MPKTKRQIDVVDIEDAEDYLSARRALQKTVADDDVSEAPSEPPPEPVIETVTKSAASAKLPISAPPMSPLATSLPTQPEAQPPVAEEKEAEALEVKPAPKRTVRKKVVKTAPVQETAPVPEEVKPPPEPPAPAHSDNKVSCPDCGRSVSIKTLRYTHKYQCPVRYTRQTTQSVGMREPSPETTRGNPAPAKPVMMKSPFLRKPPESRYEHLQFF